MRGAGCPTAFCGSSGALVWLQTALMCLNYTDNNNEMCNNNNINRRVTVSQGKKTTRWPEPALSWTLSATRKWIRVGSETWSSQGIWYGGGERVSGAGYRELGTGNWEPGTACQPIKCMSKCRSGSHNASRIIPSLSLSLFAFSFWLLPEKTSH